MKLKYTIFSCVLSIATLVVFPGLGVAETPTEAVNTMVAQLKKAGSPKVMVDFIHWPTVYEALNTQEKAMRKVNSPEELRDQYKQLFSDPTLLLHEQIKRFKEKMPEDQHHLLDDQIAKAEAMLNSMMEKMKEKISKTNYTVAGVEEDGEDKALVKLVSTTDDGKSETNDLRLVKVKKKWYLSTLESLKKTEMSGQPTGKVSSPPAKDVAKPVKGEMEKEVKEEEPKKEAKESTSE